jgi:hypothetical protein
MSTPDEHKRNSESSGSGDREEAATTPRDEGYLSFATMYPPKGCVAKTHGGTRWAVKPHSCSA